VKDVIILGMGSTMVKCPYDAETWGVNQVYRMAKKLDRLFITDGRYKPDKTVAWDWDALNKLDIPIVSLHRFPEIKRLVRYPYNQIISRFDGLGREFFTNSICYMIAYALYKDYEKIRLYGIDMATSMEYILERGGIEYWIGRAEGMGVKVENTKGSMVCKTPMGIPYGHKYAVNMKEVDPYGLLKGKQPPSR
jgi:hypothetical protein